ncbi:MAG TPA: alpha-glucan family phosphorylase, partial [Verrucomicrobiae bacterium]|nr:alpha-glucan family phosphorylase [Verrucomicrobiae bacterium]
SLGIPLEVDTLVFGFARRFATYKRVLLLFRDLARLEQIIKHPHKPVAFIFAGKAHPADGAGQELIRRIVEVSRHPRFQHSIFFVENYDLSTARCLVQGVDVWLNTPLKPLEASGTSGQKAAINGVINCSVLDGWWNEGYNGHNGWAIPGAISANREEQDNMDGEDLYRLLADEIIPLYYGREGNISREWLRMMKESICSLTPVYSTSRMVAEYREKCYLPTAARGKRFKENGFAIATRVADYKQFIRKYWHQVEVQATEVSGGFTGLFTVRAKIRLGPIWCKDVRVQAVGSDGHGGIWQNELQILQEASSGIYWYEGTFPGTTDSWLHSNANVRVLPISPEFVSDFELELARWGQQIWR